MTIVLLVFVLGVVLGSFVNALVWRIHEQASSNQKRHDTRLSILKGHSMCPYCRHRLAAKDLVPVLSWLSLKGRCRYCKKPISSQYPIVELLTGLLLVIGYVWWPAGYDTLGLVQFGFFAMFTVFFMALAIYDLRWFLLPSRLVYPLVGVATANVIITALWQGSFADFWQPLAGATLIYGIFWGLYQVSKGQWIGGGDVRLAIALGLIAGTPVKALLVIFLASLLGTFASLPILTQGKKALERRIPFGPALLMGCYIVILFGTAMIEWYQGILL